MDYSRLIISIVVLDYARFPCRSRHPDLGEMDRGQGAAPTEAKKSDAPILLNPHFLTGSAATGLTPHTTPQPFFMES